MFAAPIILFFFFFNDTATTEIYTLSLHDALPISVPAADSRRDGAPVLPDGDRIRSRVPVALGQRSEEHTSELQSRLHLVCRLLLEKKKSQIHARLNYSHDLPHASVSQAHTSSVGN